MLSKKNNVSHRLTEIDLLKQNRCVQGISSETDAHSGVENPERGAMRGALENPEAGRDALGRQIEADCQSTRPSEGDP